MTTICHVQVLPQLTGPQRSMLDLFTHLDRRRYRLHVVCQRPGELTERLEPLGVRCHYVPSLVRHVSPLRDALAARELLGLFRSQRFDVVHTHSTKPGLLGRWAAARAGVPHVVHHVRGFACHEFSPGPWRWLCGRMERWAGSYCDQAIFVNHEERHQAIEAGWLPAEKCRTIFNGADLARMAPWHHASTRQTFRARHGIGPDDVALVSMMRLERQKQPWIIPAIASELSRMTTRHPWRWLVAGCGPFRDAVAARLRELRLEHRVQLLGWLDDPQPAYQAADVIVHPTLWEGLPRTLIEAQAAAVPCVASDVKGNREVITPETGVLCPPRDAASYAGALARLVNEPQLRRDLGDRARSRAEQEFDGQRQAGEIAALYDELLGATTIPDQRPAELVAA